MTKRLFANIDVKHVDISLLREQRDDLLDTIETMKILTKRYREHSQYQQQVESLGGVVNLLDAMLDIAEGY